MTWEHPIHTYPPEDALKMALAEIERLHALLNGDAAEIMRLIREIERLRPKP